MSLSQAISTALSGLRVAQTGIGVVADNVANAETPGYVRKTVIQGTSASGGGVEVLGISRELDLFTQRQLRAEFAGAAYADAMANFYARLERIYGQPGNLNAIDTLYSNFTNALQALVGSPDSTAVRAQVLNEANVLTNQLNAMSQSIQQLRTEAEHSLADAVGRVNEILSSIERVSEKIFDAPKSSAEAAALLDQRDLLIGELSGFIDIRVLNGDRNQISIFTTSGVSLYDHKAALLRFDSNDFVGATSFWNADPDLNGVGTIKVASVAGNEVDLVADRAIRSGSIAAYLEMRDRTLVEAQAQLDEIAHALALALSNRTVAGAGVVDGDQAGFELDLADLQNGNAITLTYTSNGTGTQHRVTIVRVDDPGALPLADSFTPDPGDRVIGVDFSGGIAGVVAALNAELGATGLAFDNPAGSTLRVLDDGLSNAVDVNGFSATVTASTFNSGDPTLPFFVDGGAGLLYTNAVTANGSQKIGFAGRLAVNSALKFDPSQLVHYAPGAQAGDPTRPNFLEQQLSAASRLFSPATGIGTSTGPYSGTIGDFIRQTISKQGAAAENSKRLKEGQDIVVNALQQRFVDRSSVNIDSEMAHLLLLQTAYGANARVLTAVREMMDVLMRI